MVTILFVIVLLILILVAANMLKGFFRSRIDRTTVQTLDLKRYMGTWYEIARIENRFEQGMTAVKAQYRLMDDGSVEVINTGTCPITNDRKVSVGMAHATSKPGQFKVSFMKVFSADYNVLELDENYDWALVGSSSPTYLWVLSRRPSLSADVLENLRIRAQERGYDIEQLIMVDQRANLV